MTALTATAHLLPASGNIPNNPDLPLLLYRQVFPENNGLEKLFKDSFKQNNWRGAWTNGVFGYHHYHSNSHEVLGVLAGEATLIFGGTGGQEIRVVAGDMAVLPAGTGHCCKSASADFKVIGAYPVGQEDYDICTEKDDVVQKSKQIARVPLPALDPAGGATGPLLQHWKAS